MKEQLVSLQVAETAKKLGFDEICIDSFNAEGEPQERYNINIVDNMYIDELREAFELQNSSIASSYTARPTQTLLHKWIRENYLIYIDIGIDDLNWNFRLLDISKLEKGDYVYLTSSYAGFHTFEDALESGLKRALEYIKEN